MDPRKQAILSALDAFTSQRSGMDFRNYGDVKSFRAEQRRVTRDLHDYRAIRAVVAACDSITADMILEASLSAFSGRLFLQYNPIRHANDSQYERDMTDDEWRAAGLPTKLEVYYCTGQYFPTEYRRAACAVLASALWYWQRENMPAPLTGEPRTYVFHRAGHKSPDALSAGDWLRAHFRREFGRHIAWRYFD